MDFQKKCYFGRHVDINDCGGVIEIFSKESSIGFSMDRGFALDLARMIVEARDGEPLHRTSNFYVARRVSAEGNEEVDFYVEFTHGNSSGRFLLSEPATDEACRLFEFVFRELRTIAGNDEHYAQFASRGSMDAEGLIEGENQHD